MSETAYLWRDATSDDLVGLAMLDNACNQTDGPELIDWGAYQDKISAPDSTIGCAVTSQGEIAAVAWAKMSASPAMLGGRVHPEHRRKGLGSQAARWAEAQVLKHGPEKGVFIRNESFTSGAEALYQQQGYVIDFVAYWMSKPLQNPLPEMPADVRLVAWSDSNERIFYDTFIDSFQDRGGPRESTEHWISLNKDDEDFRSDMCLLAYLGDEPVAFVTAQTFRLPGGGRQIGWISQIGVRPAWRGSGIIDGLIGVTGRSVMEQGIATVDLDVDINNPRAIRVYERNGFKPVGKRAKFSKILD